MLDARQIPVSTEAISGMGKDVALTARAVNLMTHHGSRQSCHRLPEMVLNYVSVLMNQASMRMLLLL